jgi:hypothetical protein
MRHGCMSKNPQPDHCSQGPSRTVLEQSVLQNCYRLFEPCLIDVSTLLSIVRTGLRTKKQVSKDTCSCSAPRNGPPEIPEIDAHTTPRPPLKSFSRSCPPPAGSPGSALSRFADLKTSHRCEGNLGALRGSYASWRRFCLREYRVNAAFAAPEKPDNAAGVAG